MAFKFLKKQTKSENHEICRDIEITYVEIAVKIGYDSQKLTHMLLTNRSTHLQISSMNVDTYVALFYEC